MAARRDGTGGTDFVRRYRGTRSHADPEAPAGARPGFRTVPVEGGGRAIRDRDGNVVDYRPASRVVPVEP